MKLFMQGSWKYILMFLTLIASLVLIALFTFPDKNLHLIACDVGQGDAILAIQGETQILIDGGPSSAVIDCLSEFIPFWDRRIEAVLLTHPQKDHYIGLIEVFRRYHVQNFIAIPLDVSSSEYGVLKKEVGSEGSVIVNPSKGMTIRLGLIYLDILWPSKEFLAENLNNFSENKRAVLGAFTSSIDPNKFSVVAILSFKNFDALLGGDASESVGREILSFGTIRDVEYIKMPHHGSRNSAYKEFIEQFTPEVAVISAGKNNPYGHPHQEVINLLRKRGIRFLRTDEQEEIEISSDGNVWWIE